MSLTGVDYLYKGKYEAWQNFLYSKQIEVLMLLPASSIGLLSAGVLNLNNMRDIESDRRSKKQTLAGYFGLKIAKL